MGLSAIGCDKFVDQNTNMATEQMTLRGTLKGHKGWVTKIATTPAIPEMILSASRDKSLIVWKLTRDETTYGVMNRRLCGHSHFVSDVVISTDGQFALSGSWDGDLRLWNLQQGITTRRFTGHTKDVLSVAFSGDNRQIVSASRDKTIKLWNTLGQCKYTIVDDGHDGWVSCVQFSPNPNSPIIVSSGWDKVVMCGTWLTASSRPTTMDTLLSSTLSPSHLTVHCVLQVAKMDKLCCGI